MKRDGEHVVVVSKTSNIGCDRSARFQYVDHDQVWLHGSSKSLFPHSKPKKTGDKIQEKWKRPQVFKPGSMSRYTCMTHGISWPIEMNAGYCWIADYPLVNIQKTTVWKITTFNGKIHYK